jgi:hypothetical protein
MILAELPVRAALASMPAAPSESAAPLGKVVVGDQVVKDWLREGEGLVLRTRDEDEKNGAGAGAGDGDGAGDGWMTETVCTGPFQAHFVSACGALESALRAAGTCRRPARPADRSSRWTLGGKGFGARRDADTEAEEEEEEAAACAAARVMLAASRTVRSGDALDLVMELFSNEEGGGGGGGGTGPTWLINALQPAEMKRLLARAGPIVSVSVSADRVVVTARDVFYVARAAPPPDAALGRGDGDADDDAMLQMEMQMRMSAQPPQPWAAVALVSKQELTRTNNRRGHLELTSQSLGLDPGVPQSLLDAFLRERGPTPTIHKKAPQNSNTTFSRGNAGGQQSKEEEKGMKKTDAAAEEEDYRARRSAKVGLYKLNSVDP